MNIIIFHDNTIKEITDEQKEKIYQASSNPNIKHMRIDDDLIAFSSISRIVKEDNYYSQHPDKRPQYENYTFSDADEFRQLKERKMLERKNYKSILTRAEKERRPLEQMIKGLKRFIGGKPLSPKNSTPWFTGVTSGKAEALLEKMEAKLKLIK